MKPFPSDEVRACLRSPHCGFISDSTSVSYSYPVGPVNAWWSEIKEITGSGVGTKTTRCVGMQPNMTFLWDQPGSGVGISHAFKSHTSKCLTRPQRDGDCRNSSHTTACTCIFFNVTIDPHGKTWLGEGC